METKITNQSTSQSAKKEKPRVSVDLDKYKLKINDIVVDINILWYEDEPVPQYVVSLTNISDTTKIILEKIINCFLQVLCLYCKFSCRSSRINVRGFNVSRMI